MIDVFYYSIAGKKTNQSIDDLVQKFIDSEFIPQSEKKVLKHVQKVSLEGNYPSTEYFSIFYPERPAVTYRSIAEISSYCKDTILYYQRQDIEKKIISAINDSDDISSLVNKIQSISDVDTTEETLDVVPQTYGRLKGNKLVAGIKSGIQELDEVTYGFQPGTVGSVCAFTGHGKSTFVESVLFKSALEGQKSCLWSLELAPDIIWPQLEARYMYQVKGIQVTAQDIQFQKMPSDIEEKVLAAEPDFERDICANIIVLDESYLSKAMMLNYKTFSSKMRQVAAKLGGLDIVAFDHVGQFELMFPDCGNQIIKSIQSFSKTFQDDRGVKPFTLLAVQANRGGEARARKRNGVYDMQAISDLNEVERTSTYVIFMYTSDDMKIMQETKVTLSKHRLGPVITEPIVTTFNPAVITVGASVESVSMSDDDFNDLDLDLGTGFDDFV